MAFKIIKTDYGYVVYGGDDEFVHKSGRKISFNDLNLFHPQDFYLKKREAEKVLTRVNWTPFTSGPRPDFII